MSTVIDLTPSVDRAPNLASRLVTVNLATITEGDLPDKTERTVSFRLVGDIHAASDRVIVGSGYTAVARDGDSVRLPVWTAGTGEWAIEVKKSWAPHEYFIRVPAGATSIDLSQINPLTEAPAGVAEWLLTNAAVTISEGADWDASVSISGGTANFHIVAPPGGEAVKRPLLSNANQAGLSFGFYDTNPSTIGIPAAVNSSLVHIPFGSLATQLWIRWGSSVEVSTRWLNSSSQGAWRRIDNNPATLTAESDLATLPSGTYLASTPVAVALGLPGDIGGYLQHVGVAGQAQYQLYVPAGAEARLYIQKFGSTGTPTGWARADAGAVEIPAPIISGSPSSGWQTVPLAVTMPGATVTQTAASGSVRWVRRWAHMPGRVRLHVSNRHPSTPGSTGAAMSLVGAKIGVGTAAGGLSDTVSAFGAAAVPTDGSELISRWIDCHATDGEYLGITLAWTGGTTQHVMQGGGWTQTGTTAGWDGAAVTGWTRQQTTPLYVWIEAEVPARVPVLAVNGDSISIGSATDDPVGDGWPAVYAFAEGALPVLYAQHGSSMPQWVETNPRWDLLYPAMPQAANAVVTALGQNDLQTGVTLSTLKARYEALRDAHDALFPDAPAYVAGLTPSNKEPAIEAVRRDFNTWLASLPRGERRFFDFAAVVGDSSDEDLAPGYSADGVHPNSAGQALLGALLAEYPVTPYTPTTTALRTI